MLMVAFWATRIAVHGGFFVKVQRSWWAILQPIHAVNTTPQKRSETPAPTEKGPRLIDWRKWLSALRLILPTYLLIHIAFLLLTLFAPIINFPTGSYATLPLHTLWQSWRRWDTAFYTDIASKGYMKLSLAVYFPLYPLLIRSVMPIIHNPFISGVIVSNAAMLVACVVFYQLVREEFGEEQADRSIVYLLLYPAAFFLVTVYTESLFLCLSIFCFYHMRHGRWWLAGFFGFLCTLTRSTGILLMVPFFFEYLRQRQFKLQSLLHFDLLSNALIPVALCLYGLYNYQHFHDFFAFKDLEARWGRTFHMPWDGFIRVYQILTRPTSLVGFYGLHNLLAISIDLFVLLFIILTFVGPWHFPRTHRVYCIYALIMYIFIHCTTTSGDMPLESMIRYLMSIFPIFIIFSIAGKHQNFHRGYMIISGTLLCFLALLFISGRWMT